MLNLLNPLWKYICAVLSASTLVLGLVVHIQSGQIHKWHVQNDGNVAAREADRAAYAQAQKDAAVLNNVQVAKVKQQQQEITDATVSRLNSRLVLISNELRKQATSAPPSAPGSAQAGNPVATPCRALDPAWLCLSPEERLLAAQNEERHDDLIDLVIEQSKVNPN